MRILKSLIIVLVLVVIANGQSPERSVSSESTETFVASKVHLDLTARKYARSTTDTALFPDPQSTTSTYVFPSAGHRAKRYAKSMVGPFALGRIAFTAGLDQWNDEPEEWGQGSKGYGKRFASNFGKNAIRQTVTYGLSEAFRLDTGFEKSKRKGFWPRLSDALVQNVTSRTRSGKRILSVPIFAGAYAGSIIPYETWYPSRYSYKDGLRSGTYSLAAGFGLNVLREFVFNW
jgi:hypothetical protein